MEILLPFFLWLGAFTFIGLTLFEGLFGEPSKKRILFYGSIATGCWIYLSFVTGTWSSIMETGLALGAFGPVLLIMAYIVLIVLLITVNLSTKSPKKKRRMTLIYGTIAMACWFSYQFVIGNWPF